MTTKALENMDGATLWIYQIHITTHRTTERQILLTATTQHTDVVVFFLFFLRSRFVSSPHSIQDEQTENDAKRKLDEATAENRQLKSVLNDAQTNIVVLRSELSKVIFALAHHWLS